MTFTITPPHVHSTDSADVEVLIERVAELQRVQRTEDVEGFLALFDEDAVWVTGGGRRLVGRENIAAFTRTVLPGSFEKGSVRYDVEHIRFITPDVALTGVNQEYLTSDERSLSPRQEGRPSYVWHRRDGEWRIASGQNTGVVATDAVDDEASDASSAPDEARASLTEEDLEAIRLIVDDVEQGFNTNDPEPMMRHIATDALVVNALGVVLHGRDEIDTATQAGLAHGPLRTATAHYRVTDITVLAPDVAVAHKSAWATRTAADAGQRPEMNALYVFARRDGRWWIIRRQNTLVYDAEG